MQQTAPKTEAKSAARLAFIHYPRTGRRLAESAFEPAPVKLEAKFNPYHDPRNGQFTFAPGGPRALGQVVISDRRRSANASASTARETRPSVAPDDRFVDAVYRPDGRPSLFQPA